MSEPIQTRVKLSYMSTGSGDFESLIPDMLSFTYDDKETNEADEISVTLKDPNGRWANELTPHAGAAIGASIVMGTVTKNLRNIYCGKFFIDSMRCAGSPRTFEMRAVSIPLNKPIRRKLKSKAWEGAYLKDIAEKIAKDASIKLIFDSKENPKFDRQDQNRESDLKFLSRLCEDAGLSLKMTDEQLVIFDQASYETKKPIKTLTLGESPILSWSFEAQQSETYKSCTVSYRDPKQKKASSAGGFYMTEAEKEAYKKSKNSAVMTYTYVDPYADENGQEYALKKRATSVAEAERLAKAQLRKLNARRVTGSISCVGDIDLLAGVVIECKGFGSFDGKFIVSQATHSVSGSGYITSLSLRRVNAVY